jgi:Domain of unknown function (DUF4169)
MGSAGNLLSGSKLIVAEVINLRLARKAKARSAAAQQAAENRALHGQSKALRKLHEGVVERANRELDGARREGED